VAHELSHLWRDTDDFGYSEPWGDPDSYVKKDEHGNVVPVELTTAQRLKNADTYEGYLEEYYIRDGADVPAAP
jgi:hypothetical protein